MARAVHRHDQMVKLAAQQDGVAGDALHGAPDPAGIRIAEAACQLGVVEHPAAVCLVAQDASAADAPAVVGQAVEPHQHLPRHAPVEGFGQGRIIVVGGIEIVGGLCFCATIIDVAGGIVEGGGAAMLADLAGIVGSVVDDAIRREADVEQTLGLLHLVLPLQGSCNDLLRNQGIVDVLRQQCGPGCRGMQAVQGIEIPVASPCHAGAVYIGLAELLRNVPDTGVGIGLRPAFCVLVVHAVAPREDAEADDAGLRIAGRQLVQESLVSTSERDGVREVRRPVFAQGNPGYVPVVSPSGNEDKVRIACPPQGFHAVVAQERGIAVQLVGCHTAAAPRRICQEGQARHAAELHPPGIAHLKAHALLAVLRIIDGITRRQIVVVGGDGVAQNGKGQAVGALGCNADTKLQEQKQGGYLLHGWLC